MNRKIGIGHNQPKKRKKKKIVKKIKKKKFSNNLFSEDQKSQIISTVLEYVNQHTKLLNDTYYKNNKVLEDKIKKNILNNLEKVIVNNEKRTTFPDELTSIYLEDYYNHKKKNRNLFIKAYADQKQAEMKIGNLLELYIQKTCFDNGWCCTGTTVKDVDFIKKRENKWESYQIKLSDNTENNAGKKVRHGTEIKIWQRRISKKKNAFYWESLPDEDIKGKLSEVKFRTFIKNYFINITEVN